MNAEDSSRIIGTNLHYMNLGMVGNHQAGDDGDGDYMLLFDIGFTSDELAAIYNHKQWLKQVPDNVARLVYYIYGAELYPDMVEEGYGYLSSFAYGDKSRIARLYRGFPADQGPTYDDPRDLPPTLEYVEAQNQAVKPNLVSATRVSIDRRPEDGAIIPPAKVSSTLRYVMISTPSWVFNDRQIKRHMNALLR